MQQLQTVDADTLLYEPLEKPSFVVDGPHGLVAVLRFTENRQELAHAETMPVRVAGNPFMGYANIGGRCALPVSRRYVLPHPRQAVPSDGRSERAASLCCGKLQVIRRSYRAA